MLESLLPVPKGPPIFAEVLARLDQARPNNGRELNGNICTARPKSKYLRHHRRKEFDRICGEQYNLSHK